MLLREIVKLPAFVLPALQHVISCQKINSKNQKIKFIYHNQSENQREYIDESLKLQTAAVREYP